MEKTLLLTQDNIHVSSGVEFQIPPRRGCQGKLQKVLGLGMHVNITQGITKTETKPKWSPRQSNKEFCPISLKVLRGKFLECEIYIYIEKCHKSPKAPMYLIQFQELTTQDQLHFNLCLYSSLFLPLPRNNCLKPKQDIRFVSFRNCLQKMNTHPWRVFPETILDYIFLIHSFIYIALPWQWCVIYWTSF